ncbi:hypothetical protein AX15_001861 [Amanita polypyramis BW_CC]|nr:hypothetical protein AX15_001861 [Amanita polypyramis BW_CC]
MSMPTRHKDYYFEDIIFQVEDQLFKVPRHLFLQESEIFRDIFRCPVPKGAHQDGITDEQPLQLQVRPSATFSPYRNPKRRKFNKNPQLPAFEKMEEWTAVLELASRFEMPNIKQFAMERMVPFLGNAPAMQIYLGRKHHVREWVVSALNKLIQRAEPLRKEDIELIGLDDGLKVMALRETCMYDPYKYFQSKKASLINVIWSLSLVSLVKQGLVLSVFNNVGGASPQQHVPPHAAAGREANPVIQDEEFYFQDIIIQVDNRLFKVPRRVFIHESQVFRDMFSLPAPEGTKADGLSNDQPLMLNGIKASDFSRLLKYLFPIKQSPDSFALKTLDEWTSVLKLADQWQMEDVRAVAITRMTPLLEKVPEKQIKLSLEYNIEEWLVPGINRLARRDQPLDKNDIEEIGLDCALKIMTLREDCNFDASYNQWSVRRRGQCTIDLSQEVIIRFNVRQ